MFHPRGMAGEAYRTLHKQLLKYRINVKNFKINLSPGLNMTGKEHLKCTLSFVLHIFYMHWLFQPVFAYYMSPKGMYFFLVKNVMK